MTIKPHTAFKDKEPKIGNIVSFYHENPFYSYLGYIIEMEDLGEEGTYYTIQTNNGPHSGIFHVTVLSSTIDQ